MSSEATADITGGWDAAAPPDAGALAAALAEQGRRAAEGSSAAVEPLLAEYPALQGDASAMLELIWNELVLREGKGEKPDLPEFVARFPDLAGAIRMQWAVDRALFSEGNGAAGARRKLKPQIGRYRIAGKIAEGGMGIAYRAWDPDLKREVVVKTLKTANAGADDIARFRIESEAIARVRHPNIVQVFDVGEDDGEPFFAMEYCAGGSLAKYLGGNPLSPADAARVVEQVARGVEAAHQQKIIHRDLKPGNVLVSHGPAAPGGLHSTAAAGHTATAGGSGSAAKSAPAAGGPAVFKVTDFGLAKALDADDGQTRSGAVLGTPSYMSPEQAFGHANKVGPATDVYALGAILYEALTGRPPLRGATVPETLDQVKNREPVQVRQLQPKVPADLETIAHKCLQKDPARRYPTAGEVADDVARFLDGRPILARPVGALERGWRWCRRNPVVAGLLAGVFVSLAAGLTGTSVMWARAADREKQAEMNLRETFSAVNKYYIRISEERLLNEPHLQHLRRDLLAASRPFFESFVQKRRDDPAWKHELALAMAHIAAASQMLDPPDVSRGHWQAIVPIWENLLRENPADAAARFEMAKVYLSMGDQDQRAGRWADAERNLRTGLDHLRAVPDRGTRGYQAFHFETVGVASLSELAALRGDSAPAQALYEEALAVQNRAAAAHPDPLARVDLGVIHFRRGMSLLRNGDTAAAAAKLAEAEKVFIPLAASTSGVQILARRNLASTLSTLGVAQGESRSGPREKAAAESRDTLARAYKMWAALCQEHPSVLGYQVSLADTQYHLSELDLRANKLGLAEQNAAATLDLRKRLFRHDPGLFPDLADSYDQLRRVTERQLAAAAASSAADRLRAALTDRMRDEIALLLQARGTGQLPPPRADQLPHLCSRRACLLTRLRRPEEARAEWDRAIGLAPPGLQARFAADRELDLSP